ncbi:MAG TPA: pyrophosphatase [Candidatus Moranbacteria bacterium]|nr:MAG: Glycyl-tRNA synthetase beta subunit [Candidatus Moranbacteria bacterium GW2011_GWF1_34_10]HBI17632.1 pyrophosphatase [Candidatus Moranbacteria bacterium]
MQKYYEAIEMFHKKHKMKGTNNEEMGFRLNLMTEELGELAQAVTKGKPKKDFIEENVDLFNLIIGNMISTGVTLEEFDKIFWKKWEKIMNRKKKKVNGKFRVSDFKK